MSTNNSPNILIVEDQGMFREFLATICKELFPDSLIAMCDCGTVAIKSRHLSPPDLVLLDINLPDMDGVEVGQQLLTRTPQTRVLVVSAECSEALLLRMKKSDFAGFVDKHDHADAISAAILAVLQGGTYFSESVRKRQMLLKNTTWPKTLTNTEMKILSYLGAQLETRLIAAQFGIAEDTVLWHKKNIKHKLDLKSDAELTRFCAEKGFVLAGSGGFRPVERS
jgi:DNA-binding NarL/FixJ family response regulator